MIACHKTFRPGGASWCSRTARASTKDSGEEDGVSSHHSDSEIRAYNTLLRRYLKEITKQALFYTGAFWLCHFPHIFHALLYSYGGIRASERSKVLVATFYPWTICHSHLHSTCNWGSGYAFYLGYESWLWGACYGRE